ncbi:MAG TPA: hypothetical protein VFY53_05395 [Rhodoplanes sp.]|nr:hypothetical protein [Rhodoplanes sp.]
MKVRFTEQALKDLVEIATFLTAAYPAIAPAVEQRRPHGAFVRITGADSTTDRFSRVVFFAPKEKKF